MALVLDGSNNAVYIQGSPLAGLQLSGYGQVTLPNQPAWLCGWNGSMATTTTLTIPTGWVTPVFNVGGYFNTATGLFTSPVAGRYYVFGSFLRTSGVVVCRGNFYVNNTTQGGQYRTTEGFTGYNNSCSHSAIVSVSAGDTISFRISSDSAFTIYNDGGGLNYNYFGGYFLG